MLYGANANFLNNIQTVGPKAYEFSKWESNVITKPSFRVDGFGWI